MPRTICVPLVVLFIVCSAIAQAAPGKTLPPQTAGKIWPAVVAGQFYPAPAAELKKDIGNYLAAAEEYGPHPGGKLRALVVPHAGYVFSGPVAAYGYRLLKGLSFKRVLIIASNHNAEAEAFTLTTNSADIYQTPLGDVAVSKVTQKLLAHPLFHEVPKAHLTHIIEVQLPFLQSTLGKFELIPVITGSLDDKQLADAAALLGPLIDDDTLLVVSSDLSHYFPYELARSKDIPCITAVAAQDKAADQCDACGRDAIRILLSIARGRGWSGTVLDYRSSGDTSDNKERVVGYSAIAFHSPQEGAPEAPADRPSSRFPPLVKREFLHMARQILEAAVVSHQLPAIPVSPLLAPLLHDKTGCFVTLKKNGELRGCIGDIAPQRSPVECITDNVQNAALHDHRFPAVRGEELAALEVEISILTPPEPLTFRSPADLLSRLKAEKPGVVLATSDHSATFLPQVWEDIPIGEEFLGALCRKAGLAPNAWREGPMSIFTYKALVFREKR